MKVLEVNGTVVNEMLVSITGEIICKTIVPSNKVIFVCIDAFDKSEAMELGRRLKSFAMTGSLKLEDE